MNVLTAVSITDDSLNLMQVTQVTAWLEVFGDVTFGLFCMKVFWFFCHYRTFLQETRLFTNKYCSTSKLRLVPCALTCLCTQNPECHFGKTHSGKHRCDPMILIKVLFHSGQTDSTCRSCACWLTGKALPHLMELNLNAFY